MSEKKRISDACEILARQIRHLPELQAEVRAEFERLSEDDPDAGDHRKEDRERKAISDPEPGETKDQFVGRCIAVEIENGLDEDQASAVCFDKARDAGLEASARPTTFRAREVESVTGRRLTARHRAWRGKQ